MSLRSCATLSLLQQRGAVSVWQKHWRCNSRPLPTIDAPTGRNANQDDQATAAARTHSAYASIDLSDGSTAAYYQKQWSAYDGHIIQYSQRGRVLNANQLIHWEWAYTRQKINAKIIYLGAQQLHCKTIHNYKDKWKASLWAWYNWIRHGFVIDGISVHWVYHTEYRLTAKVIANNSQISSWE